MWLGICVLAFVFLPACERKTNPTTQPAAARIEGRDRLVVGATLPLTGDLASYGIAANRGVSLAFEQINARGGVRGRKIEVIVEDDQDQAAKAIAAVQKLISVNKVPLVIGSANSSVTLALCPIANREKVILISPISSSAKLTQHGGSFFFRVCPSDVVQAGMMAAWFAEKGYKRAGVIFVNNSWGQAIKDEFASRFAERGGEVVASEACEISARDLRTQLSKVQAAGPDAVYCITYGREGGVLLRQAKELAIDKPIYGADAWVTPELADSAQEAARGVPILAPAKFKGPGYEEFAKAFRGKYGEEPDVYATYAYDMAHVIAHALSQAERGDALRQAIASTRLEGVTGVTQFDEHGDAIGKGFERLVLP